MVRVRAACVAVAAAAACGPAMRQSSGSDAGGNPPVNDDAGVPQSVTIVGPVDGGPYVATPDASPPVDTRPPPPAPWDPPFALGAPGWRQSATPLCEPYYGSYRELALWSDERGVFVLFGTACPLQELNPCGSTGSSIQFNDGSGWRPIYITDSSVSGVLDLNGFPGGPEILAGDSCGISFIGNEAVPTCTTPTGLGDVRVPTRVFGVRWPLAYAISGRNVLQHGSGGWNTLSSSLDGPATALWGDNQTVVVAAQNRAYAGVDGGTLAAFPNVPAGFYLSAWGFGPSDVWLGNGVGQLVHYDGTAWTAMAASASGSGISKLWGVDGQVYFVTDSEFGRWNGHNVETLLVPLGGTSVTDAHVFFRGLWGSSGTEVFVSLVDTQFERYACGGEFVLWFDGNQFHRF